MVAEPLAFTYQALPSRVIFGVGSVERLGEEVERLGSSRVLVLCTSGQRPLAQVISERLAERAVGIYDRAAMHVPVETAEDARGEASRLQADCCVAVGGGSTIGLGKAIALHSSLPILAIPTTYSGSEMTPIWGLTEGGLKKTGRDVRVLPRTVIYDPALTVDLPAAVSGPSGINALAHCVEALYAPDGNPIVSLIAEEGARALAESLPVVVKEPANLQARSRALYGAWLAGSSLGAVSMGLHHKLCHTLGGTYNLPHAEVHAVILPHATRYNAPTAPEAMRRMASALGLGAGDDVPSAIYDLVVAVGAKTALKDIGMKARDLDEAAELATRNPYDNPTPITREGIRKLLEDAHHGHRPDLQVGQQPC
ncbi:MAG: maleylacetate reductase [Chloroflexota bacterium]|nr:maleylacetate reductase [Chloroflexota bacterium]